MKRLQLFLHIVSLSLLVVVLSGCTLGERRSAGNPGLEPNQSQQQANRTTTIPGGNETTPATETPASIIPPPDPIENSTEANDQEGDLGQTLLDELNALDTANQAGDSLDDLP